MNEQKLYAVKNDEGYYWDFKDLCGFDLGGFWELLDVSVPFTVSEDDAKKTAKDHGGHVVTLIEEPTPVVVSQEEAILLENLQQEILDGQTTRMTYEWISDLKDQGVTTDEIFKALDNGWEIRKETLYNVKVKYAQDSYYYKTHALGKPIVRAFQIAGGNKLDGRAAFTIVEIAEYGLQDCEKTEVKP